MLVAVALLLGWGYDNILLQVLSLLDVVSSSLTTEDAVVGMSCCGSKYSYSMAGELTGLYILARVVIQTWCEDTCLYVRYRLYI